MNLSRISYWLWLWVGIVPVMNILNYFDYIGIIKIKVYVLYSLMAFLQNFFSSHPVLLTAIFLTFNFSWFLFGFFTFYYTSKSWSRYFLALSLLAVSSFQIAVFAYPGDISPKLQILLFNILIVASLVAVYLSYPYMFFTRTKKYAEEEYSRESIDVIKERVGSVKDISLGFAKVVEEIKDMGLFGAVEHLREKLRLKAVVLSTQDGMLIAGAGGGEKEAALAGELVRLLKKSKRSFNKVEVSGDGYEYYIDGGRAITYISSPDRLEEITLEGISSTLNELLAEYTGGE